MSNEPKIRTLRTNGGLSVTAQRFGGATVDEIREALGGLVGDTDRDLLIRVSRWRKANGWTWSLIGGAWQSPEHDVTVAYDANTRELGIARGATLYRWYAVESVREAIDLLTLKNVLPVEFASMYAAGRADRAVEVAAA